MAHAADRPAEVALILTDGRTGVETRLTFGELDRRVRAFAAILSAAVPEDEPLLALIRSDIDSVVTLLACFYAGVICIPLPLPGRGTSLERLAAVASASRASVAVAPAGMAELRHALPECRWLAVEGVIAGSGWTPSRQDPARLALVQYTSGSTRAPRGVALTHLNMVANLEMLRTAFSVDRSSLFASWLPLFHDMGLAMLLMPLYFGVTGVLMPPLSFLRDPIGWLRMVDSYSATITGAPNFAYETCLRRVSDEAVGSLDLSRCRLAFCGAEPVRRSTMLGFARRFRPSGFRPTALYPCYGMAEAVCFVSGGFLLPSDEAEAIAEAGPSAAVSCGRPACGSSVVVVGPDGGLAPEGGIGEIWIAGPHVGAGYWQSPEETRDVFGATLAADDGRSFLRTGDLGFMTGGELTVTGRLKDVIIHRGAKIHAADVEALVASADPGFGEVGAAFGQMIDGSERLVVIHEAARGRTASPTPEMLAAAEDAIASQYGLRLHDLVVVRAGSLPKTSSGKVRREQCRRLYEAGGFRLL